MNPTESVLGVALSSIVASMCEAFNEPDPAYLIDRLARTEVAPSTSQLFSPFTDQRPDLAIVRWPDSTWILLGGIRNTVQGIQFVADALRGPQSNEGFQNVNPMVSNAAIQVWNRLTTFGLRSTDNYLIAGHSWGGAVAHCLSNWIETTRSGNICRSISFGAPKFGTSRGTGSMRGSNATRWMNDDDPVPFAVPSGSESARVTLLLTAGQLANVSMFEHTTDGLRITRELTVLDGFYPSIPVPDPGVALTSWFLGESMVGAPPHWIGTYAYRLRLIRAALDAQVIVEHSAGAAIASTPPDAPADPPNNAPPPPIIRSTDPAGVPVPVTVRRPSASGYQRRPDGLYIVFWQGQEIALVRTRTRARRMAGAIKRINTGLRQSTAADISELRDAAETAAYQSIGVQD